MRSHNDFSSASVANGLVTDTISIEELLDAVKENYPELLPDGILEHYGITVEKSENLRYSISANDDLHSVTEQTREINRSRRLFRADRRFGSELRDYIRNQVSTGNLVRVKNKSTHTSESTSPINADFRMNTFKHSLTHERVSGNGNANQNSGKKSFKGSNPYMDRIDDLHGVTEQAREINRSRHSLRAHALYRRIIESTAFQKAVCPCGKLFFCKI